MLSLALKTFYYLSSWPCLIHFSDILFSIVAQPLILEELRYTAFMGFPWALLLHAKFILSEWLSLVVIIPFSAPPNSSSISREKLF